MGTTTAVIYHNVAYGDALWKFDVATSALRYAHCVEVEDDINVDVVLERAFRAANRVDGSAIEQVPDGVRSLSMGDVVLVPGRGWHSCQMVGWRSETREAVNIAVYRELRRDYILLG